MLPVTLTLLTIAIITAHAAGITRTLAGCLALAAVATLFLASGHNPPLFTTPQGLALLAWFAGCSGLLLFETQRRLAVLAAGRHAYIVNAFGRRLIVAWAPVAA
jgi:hypothetical protein